MAQVSVIVPAYNAENTILETIESVLKQTFSDFELIVIDDGSQDSTCEIVNTIDDSRVLLFSYPNGGVSVARNRGIEHAKGEFISFLDNDDLWTNDKLEAQLAALSKKPESGAVYSWTVNMMVNEDLSSSFVKGSESTLEGNIYPDLLLGNFIGNGSNILVRREVIDEIGGFEPGLAFSDWDFCLRVASKFNIVVVPRPQILYRKVSGSMSSKTYVMEAAGLQALEKAYETAPANFQRLKKKSKAFLFRYCADLALSQHVEIVDLKYVQEKLLFALLLYPGIIREKYAQKLIAKLFIICFFPKKLSRLIIKNSKKIILCPDPRSNTR
ncbi:glycosyltransferase family A protein [Leptolyngbya sp. CCNP1308]|uniref:glycosyltransferase family 2 protein n=1 Tax=Leptolyngbya sp. CCNP1308 TaxID=3110255 RepID=UPI002B220CA9|nr:glycosyltransferase family A protein [Leptolyngbya sp. CCNP1308]MEA5449348.1 glycosyltransferase family A protein [Leptolyngbya sp. CCNP1308]